MRGVSLAIFALAWELFAGSFDSLLFPSFSETVSALVQLPATPEFWNALWVSNQAMVGGFALAVLVGLPLGIVLGSWQPAGAIADPFLSIMLITPTSALIPLIILAFGIGLAARMLVVFLFAFVYIVINTQAGLRSVDPSLVDMAEAFGATRTQVWRKILLPGAMPSIMVGIRVGLGRAVNGMVAVELLLIALGLGRLILRAQTNFEAPAVYAVVAVVVAEAVLLMRMAKELEARLAFWESDVTLA